MGKEPVHQRIWKLVGGGSISDFQLLIHLPPSSQMKARHFKARLRRAAAAGDVRETTRLALIPWRHLSGFARDVQRTVISSDRNCWILESAAAAGRWDLFVHFLRATSFSPSSGPIFQDGAHGAVMLAASRGHAHFCEKAIKQGMFVTSVLDGAARGWQRALLLRYLPHSTKASINLTLDEAAKAGWLEGCQLILAHGGQHCSLGVMALAAGRGGHLHIARYAKALGCGDFQPMYNAATRAGHWAVAAFALEYGALCGITFLPNYSRDDGGRVRWCGRKDGVMLMNPRSGFFCYLDPGRDWSAAVMFLTSDFGSTPALWCGMMVLMCDGYLRIKRYLASPSSEFTNHPANRTTRFLGLATRLPIELQMVLGLRAAGRCSNVIVWCILRMGMVYGLVMLKR